MSEAHIQPIPQRIPCNYEQNIMRSIGTFTMKQFLTEKMENRAENV